MQTAGNLIRAFIKLTSGMKHRQNNLECRLVQLLMLVDWDTTTVVDNRNRVVLANDHLYMSGIPGKSLVNGVVNNLINQMMQSFWSRIANIHGRTFAHSFQALKHLDIAGTIVFFVFSHSLFN